MEKFRKSLQTRLIYMRLYCAVIASLLLYGVFARSSFAFPALDFTMGICISIMMLVLFTMRKYAMALKSEDGIALLYIAEHDERQAFIMAKTGGLAINFVIFGLVFGTIVAGFFHEVVFYSLLGACLFTALVKGGLKLYYKTHV